MSNYHIPVLLKETVDLLNVKDGGTYVDVTFGGGGHTQEILKRIKGGKVIGFDRDKDAQRNLIEDERLEFVAEDFTFIETALQNRGTGPVDGILADLGISSHQIDTPERGFSFRFEGPLDMRMNQGQELTAATLLNEAEPEKLLEIFRNYGEVPNAHKLVRIITERRGAEPIRTTRQFEGMIQSCIPKNRQSKYLAQVYQGLRIEVNDELGALKSLLEASLSVLKPGGRLVIIAYHSLEDRLVKRFFRSGNMQGREKKDLYGNSLSPWKRITRKAIQASPEEIAQNSRARSARLRAVELKGEEEKTYT